MSVGSASNILSICSVVGSGFVCPIPLRVHNHVVFRYHTCTSGTYGRISFWLDWPILILWIGGRDMRVSSQFWLDWPRSTSPSREPLLLLRGSSVQPVELLVAEEPD